MNTICNDESLIDLLQADDDDSMRETAEHVDRCSHCRSRIELLAADIGEWQLARQVLTPPPSREMAGHESDEEDYRHEWITRRERSTNWTESMSKSLLSPPSHPEMLGRVGRYDVERLIGSGGMGVVFKAYDTELNRPVAVKLLAPYLASSGSARNRFAREARAAAAVVDDHVVPIHNVETDDEHPFLVMKYIAGGSLQQRLDREGPLDVCEVLRIGMQTANGLAAAHAQGLIHRDVKPSNILLDEGVDRALLTDFGLARATDDASLTRSGFHPGTPHYMSPEQVRGEAIDARSDLFGLGCVLYALCTGHPPFRSETSYAVLRRITDDTPRPIREANPSVPEWLEQIVMKLLAKSPDDRFDSAEQVAELLEDCLAHVQQPTTTPLPTPVAEFVKSFGVGRDRSLAARLGGFRCPPIGKLIAVAAFAFPLIFAGVLIVLELNKSTLTIESEIDGIPIRIMQGDTLIKKMTVTKTHDSIRIAAGNYLIVLDGKFEGLTLEDSTVSLKRGDTTVVKIREQHTPENVAGREQGTTERQRKDSSFSVEEMNMGSTYVVLCAREGGDEWLDVARRLAAAREARAIIRFDSSRPGDLLPTLTKFAPENVAYVIPPKLITPDLAGKLTELSSRIRPDKMVDFASGYITGVTPEDAMNLIDRTLAREAEELPVPRICTGIGHSWYDRSARPTYFFVMASRERGRGPILRLTDQQGEFKILRAKADISLSERTPDQNFQHSGLKYRLILSPAYGSCVLINFDLGKHLDDEKLADTKWRALLEIPVDASIWKFDGNMVVGVSPLKTAWQEDSATWNNAPEFNAETTTRTLVDGATTTVTVDVTSLLKSMQHGIALFYHSAGDETETKEPRRHMYHHMVRYVNERRQRGFEGTSIEALAGDEWKANHLDLLRPVSDGGLILFGGQGSASSSCLVSLDDLTKLEIGPSVVLNGTSFGTTTHQLMTFSDDATQHRELGTIDPSESFALQLLRKGSLGCIGGSTVSAFGQVEPAIALLCDEHKSLGQTIQAIQNGFIADVPIAKWEAGGMQPGDPGFSKVDLKIGNAHPTVIQYAIRTICLGDPAFVPFPGEEKTPGVVDPAGASPKQPKPATEALLDLEVRREL